MKQIIILLCLPFLSFSQEIKKNEIDKFTKQHRILTTTEKLKDGLSISIAVSLRSVDTTCFLTFMSRGFAVGIVNEKDPLYFLLDDSSTVEIMPIGIQSYEISRNGNWYEHQYTISKENIIKLSQHSIKSIRRYYNKNYADVDLPERKASTLKDLAIIFLEEINKPI